MLSWEGAWRHPPWQSGVWHAERSLSHGIRRPAEPGRPARAGGHASLCGALANPRIRFLAQDDLLDRAKAARLRRALEENLTDTLEPIEKPIPPDSIWGMREDYGERLPKTSRARTIYFESRREPGSGRRTLGLMRMLRSPSFRAFAEALAGRKLAFGWGMQVLRYGPGDYAGPHNDHHPENEGCTGGLCRPAYQPSAHQESTHQWLVYSRAGHFSEIVSVAKPATVTAYRLPFWHYTTPLAGAGGGRCCTLGAARDVPLSARRGPPGPHLHRRDSEHEWT